MLGIGAQYYSHIYIWLVTILSLFVFGQYSQFTNNRLQTNNTRISVGVMVLTLFMIAFIGFRPVSGRYFVDMAGYYRSYTIKTGEPFVFDFGATNKIFDNYFSFLASSYVPVEFFFLSLAVIYFIGIAWSCSLIYPRDKFASYLVYLGAFSTFSFGTNGMKAGVAASLFLVALSLYQKRKWLWMIVFVLLSWGFHHSMVLPVGALIICLFVKNPKWFFLLWLFCLVMALFHITVFQQLFASLADEQGSLYLAGSGEAVRHDLFGGFRIDFVLYSAAPIIVGWISVFKKRIKDRRYTFLLNLYTFINAIWLLCMYAEFTNRIAYLSWFLLPVVLIYPFLNEFYDRKQYKSFQLVAFGHLAFTLFLKYVYWS